MTKIVLLPFILVSLIMGSEQSSCFDGGCNLVTDAGLLDNTQFMISQTQPDEGLTTVPTAIAMLARRPCLLTSSVCDGTSGLDNSTPCCCEVYITEGVTEDYLISIDGKFKDDLEGLRAWNNVDQIVAKSRIQLCQIDNRTIITKP